VDTRKKEITGIIIEVITAAIYLLITVIAAVIVMG
jgi:hypothetical protein